MLLSLNATMRPRSDVHSFLKVGICLVDHVGGSVGRREIRNVARRAANFVRLQAERQFLYLCLLR